jgi:hypothetical protein
LSQQGCNKISLETWKKLLLHLLFNVIREHPLSNILLEQSPFKILKPILLPKTLLLQREPNSLSQQRKSNVLLEQSMLIKLL